jgi:hypothetical protein
VLEYFIGPTKVHLTKQNYPSDALDLRVVRRQHVGLRQDLPVRLAPQFQLLLGREGQHLRPTARPLALGPASERTSDGRLEQPPS